MRLALSAAVVPDTLGADTGELRGEGTKALKSAPQLSSTAPVKTKLRAMSAKSRSVQGSAVAI